MITQGITQFTDCVIQSIITSVVFAPDRFKQSKACDQFPGMACELQKYLDCLVRQVTGYALTRNETPPRFDQHVIQ